jgi:hypothetical protein
MPVANDRRPERRGQGLRHPSYCEFVQADPKQHLGRHSESLGQSDLALSSKLAEKLASLKEKRMGSNLDRVGAQLIRTRFLRAQ